MAFIWEEKKISETVEKGGEVFDTRVHGDIVTIKPKHSQLNRLVK